MPKHQLCRNCGHEIDHNYCPACGQRTTTDRLTWASLVDSVSSTFIGDEAYGLRGINMRKGAVMTWLAILIHPYVSVSEFILGHRRKYFNPVAILLMLSTFYAVVFALVSKEFTPTARADSPLFRWLICSYYDYATLHPAANMLLMLPFYALAMKTVFRRRSDLKYVEYLYIGIFLSVFEITLMILALPAELFIPWYSSFYMQMLPVFIYTGFVFRKLFGLKKKGAVLRTLLANGLQYVYAFFAALGLLTLSLGIYYLVAPEKFKEELNIRNRDARTEQVEGSQQGEGALTDSSMRTKRIKAPERTGRTPQAQEMNHKKMSRKTDRKRKKPQQQGTIPLRETPQVVRAAGRPCLESKLWGAPRSGDAAKR